MPEPRQAGGSAQLERLGLLAPGDLQRLIEERLRLLDGIAVHVEENLGPQPVQLGIVVVLALLLGLRDAVSERPHGGVVAPDLPEALGEHREQLGSHDPAPKLCQLVQRLLHLRDARLALFRLHPRPTRQNPAQAQVQREPKPLGEPHDFFGAFPHPVELTALEVDKSSNGESIRQTERMFHARRQHHSLLAQRQRPVGMTKVRVTPSLERVRESPTIESHQVGQRPVHAGVVRFDAPFEMLQRPREVPLEDRGCADFFVSRDAVEGLPGALGGCQGLLRDLGCSREVTLDQIGRGHSREHSRQLG